MMDWEACSIAQSCSVQRFKSRLRRDQLRQHNRLLIRVADGIDKIFGKLLLS
jgi:hypothetical protein